MVESKWYRFSEVEVPSAADPDANVAIPNGAWNVTFDDFVSRAGNGPECEISIAGHTKFKILRATLIKLCEQGLAAAL
jgi:hypothetical protein